MDTTTAFADLPTGLPAASPPASRAAEISLEDGRRLLRIVLRGSRSAITWRRAQIVSLAAQKLSPAQIGEIVSADQRTVGNVLTNFDRDRFDSLDPGYRGGRPLEFGPAAAEAVKRAALTDPHDVGKPFAAWNLARLADYLVAGGVVADISHEDLRGVLLREGVRLGSR